MIPLPLDVTRLADLTFLQKARLPVSAAVDTAGSPVVISRYEDDVWNFWPYISRENAKDGEKRIIWGIALPDGSRLTDEAHRSLLASAKDFIWSLHVDPIEGGKRLGLKTLISLMGNLARISHRKRCTGPSDARKLLCKERFSATTESGPMQTQCNPKQ
ncbi:hypothetical protein ACLI4B_02240, partial [Pseudomonas aeruginosa]